MKRIILLLAVISVCVSSFGQRLNKQGLKMVSEMECYEVYRGQHYLLKFKYDENDKLTRMTVYFKQDYTKERLEQIEKTMSPKEQEERFKEWPKEYALYRDFIMDENGFNIKDYSYSYNFKYETVLDCYGNVRSITYTCGSMRNEHKFFYESDGNGGSRNVGTDITEAYKSANSDSWQEGSVGTLQYRSKDKNDPEYIKEYNRTYDTSRVDDINMSWSSAFYCSDVALRFFDVPDDWSGSHPKHLPKDKFYKYHYDDKGNLICIERGFWDDPKPYIKKRITIKYVY